MCACGGFLWGSVQVGEVHSPVFFTDDLEHRRVPNPWCAPPGPGAADLHLQDRHGSRPAGAGSQRSPRGVGGSCLTRQSSGSAGCPRPGAEPDGARALGPGQVGAEPRSRAAPR